MTISDEPDVRSEAQKMKEEKEEQVAFLAREFKISDGYRCIGNNDDKTQCQNSIGEK